MPCYKPLSAWRVSAGAGKSRIYFSKDEGNFWDTREGIDLPCGQCIGCRLERSRRWAVRIMHEAQMHEASCFITLTYSDEHVPRNGSLDVRDFQLFMKRLRRGSSGPLRFFHCGEYGDQTARPHYHACLFGEDFLSDRQLLKANKQGDPLYVSDKLSEAWGLGHANFGALTFESAAYVARYCLKKISGAKAADHYGDRKPEYVTMSRRPGIGATWFARFGKEVYPSDSTVMRGKEMMPPPFYDKLLEKTDPLLFAEVKAKRISEAGDFYDNPDNRSGRLLVREEVKQQTVKNTLRRD